MVKRKGMYRVEEIEVDEVLFQKLANRNRAEGLKAVDVSLNIVNLNKINDNSIALRFQYLTKYENVGYLKVTGNAVLSELPANELEEKWEKGEPHETFGDILNGLYYFVSPVAITLSTSLGLPPASIPFIKGTERNTKKQKA